MTQSPDVDPAGTTDPPPHTTRRTVLAGAAGAAAVAALAGGAATVPGASARSGSDSDGAGEDDGAPAGVSVIAHVRAGSYDEVVVASGDREVVLTNRALVRALVREVR
ncbi:MAG: hypothetical protein ACFCVF_01210 [Kineosporiaceae bacterium]